MTLIVINDLVAAIKASAPSEEAVHAALAAIREPRKDSVAEPIVFLGMLTAAQFKYIDTHVRVPQHQVRQGRRPDTGGPLKAAAVKSYLFKFYKEEIR